MSESYPAIRPVTYNDDVLPSEKVAAVEALRAAGHAVLMVGDGLNDGPALAAASVSASPSTAADVSQTMADLVFQGAELAPVAVALRTAKRAGAVMRQNLALSVAYDLVTVPLAVSGYVTPWLAVFLWSLRTGQYDDMDGASNRILFDEE